jgi:hypothetical protein
MSVAAGVTALVLQTPLIRHGARCGATSYNCHKAGMPMDRSTRVTLWIAAVVLLSYFVWFFADCAMDDACRFVCVNNGRGGCYTEWKPDPDQPK